MHLAPWLAATVVRGRPLTTMCLLAFASILPACRFDPPIPSGRLRCEKAEDCPDRGFVCRQVAGVSGTVCCRESECPQALPPDAAQSERPLVDAPWDGVLPASEVIDAALTPPEARDAGGDAARTSPDVPDLPLDTAPMGDAGSSDGPICSSEMGKSCNSCGGLVQCDGTCPKPIGRFEMIGPVPGLNSPQNDDHLWLSDDGKIAYFSSTRAAGMGFDIWSATLVQGSFAVAPASVPGVNTTKHEDRPWLSADGLRLYFERGDLSSEARIYWAVRKPGTAGFDPPRLVAGINDGLNGGPWLTWDERRIYFTRVLSSNDMFVADAMTPGVFKDARPVPGVDLQTSSSEQYATLSHDELTLYFQSDRHGGKGKGDIWMASRKSTDREFDRAVNVEELNTAGEEQPSFLSKDECTLYFASDRATAPFLDLFFATRRKPQ
jgi:hypothetical protein